MKRNKLKDRFLNDHNFVTDCSFPKDFFAFFLFYEDLHEDLLCQVSSKYKAYDVTHLLIWHGMTHKQLYAKDVSFLRSIF